MAKANGLLWPLVLSLVLVLCLMHSSTVESKEKPETYCAAYGAISDQCAPCCRHYGMVPRTYRLNKKSKACRCKLNKKSRSDFAHYQPQEAIHGQHPGAGGMANHAAQASAVVH